MIKIKNFAKNSLNSFILLPFLLGNVASPELIDNKTSTIPEVVESIGLNFQNFKHDDATDFTVIDDRAAKIDAYFAQWDLPLAGHGKGMVAAADKYGIDWRLLPALAMLETTGGKNLCDEGDNFNPFGYGSCTIHFDTFEDAFDAVAKTLSGNSEKTSHLYKGKTVEEILEVYNPPEVKGIMPGYHKKALNVMSKMENMDVKTLVLAKA